MLLYQKLKKMLLMKQNSIFSLLWVVLIFSNFVIGQVDNERKM
jgi:hypothetical protein